MERFILFIVSILLTCSFSIAQNWNQIGQDIDGEAAGDKSGQSVSLSSDGNTVAIGAQHNGGQAGHVRIYNYNGSAWNQVGGDINGEVAGDHSGYSVTLSSDGNTVAIGAQHNHGNGTVSGHVRIYTWNGTSWNQLGNDIDGESAGDYSGYSVSISSDGNTVAIGAPGNDAGYSSTESGHVRIFTWNGSSWNQLGYDIDAEGADDLAADVSLSSDGNTVAIGAHMNDGNGSNSGHVRIYNFDGNIWNQIGQDIDGEAAGDLSGNSVSLSSNGNIVAIGARENNGNGTHSGHVRAYENINGTWIQIGQDIDGQAMHDNSGCSVSLNSNGTIIAIGAWGNDNPGLNSGHARIYEWNGTIWSQIGQDIDGVADSDDFGFSIALSNDGNTVAIGATRNDGNGQDAGHVRIFNFTTPGCTDSLACNYDAAANTDDGGCNYATSSTTDVTACDSYSWNGTTYDISGTYSYAGVNNNYSMSFDGQNSYIEVANSNYIEIGSSDFSIQFWLKTGDQNRAHLISKSIGSGQQNPTNEAWYFVHLTNSGRIEYEITDGYSYSGDYSSATSTSSVNDNDWHHVAIVFDRDLDGSIYIDGILDVSSSISNHSGSLNNGYNLEIGVDLDLGVHYLSGALDNIQIWNKTLTQQEIQSYMSCPPTGSESDLVGYWNFEEGSGNTTYDQTSNGNNGTINGATYDPNVSSQSCGLTNVNGCDSTVVLNLTINQADTSYTTVAACDSLVWNGTTYDSSGTYSYSSGGSNNYSMSFDGVDNNIEIQEIPDYELNQHTLSLWYYSSNVTVGDLLTKDGESIDRQWLLQIETQATNRVQTHVWTTSGLFSDFSNNGLNDNTWYYLTQVWDGDSLKLYINGILDSYILTTGTLVSGDQPIRIGGGSFSSDPFYADCTLDEVEIWNTALTQQEIQQYMSCPPTGNESGLVGYWNFEQGSGTTAYDQTSNENNGTINGATYNTNVPIQSCALTNSNGCDSTAVLNLTINQADTSYTNITACDSVVWNGTTYTQSGTYSSNTGSNNNYSMSFDGQDDYISVTNNPDFEIPNYLTFGCWVNPAGNNSGSIIVNKQLNMICSYGIEIHQNNKYALRLSINGNNNITVESNSTVVNNTWTYVICQYDGSELRIYINGVLENTTSATGNIDLSSDILMISGDFDGTSFNQGFSGNIKNVELWNICLTTQEIQQYMNCPPTGSETGLVGYWNFEEGPGSTVALDQTSNGNNGTINGATYNSNVPAQSCNLTNANGCDSTAILNLTINQGDTSYTNITACDSVVWNGTTYNQSGTYISNVGSNNNYSMSFDGNDDYVNIGVDLIQSTPFTITTDVYISTLQVNNIIISENNSWCIYIRNPGNGTMQLSMWNELPGSSNNGGWVEFEYQFIEHEWYNISFSYDASFSIAFINGIAVTPSVNSMSPLIFNNGQTQVGYWGTDNESFNGKIDNFAIWNYVLDSTEINQYMSCPPTGNESGLVGYWNFEEGPGSTVALDQTSNGNNGTINGATYDTNVPSQSCNLTNTNGCDSTAILNLTINQGDTSYTNITACDSLVWNGTTYGQSGTYNTNVGSNNNYSMNFDGVDDYVNLGNSNDFDFSNSSMTVMCWVNVRTGSNLWRGIVDKSNLVNSGWYLCQYPSNPGGGANNIQGNELALAGAKNSTYFAVGSNISYSANEWHHIVGVFENGSQKFYYDGVLTDTYSWANDLAATSTNLMFGKKFGDQFFDGLIDDVSIWNTVLPQQDIQEYMTCPPTGNESGLVGYWNFEEGSGTTALDLTSNGNNGTINGATYDTNVPTQYCNLTNANGCDSIAVLNLTINQADTSYTNVIACDSYTWNDSTYTQSGIYTANVGSNINYSMSFDGASVTGGNDYLLINNLPTNGNVRTYEFYLYAEPHVPHNNEQGTIYRYSPNGTNSNWGEIINFDGDNDFNIRVGFNGASNGYCYWDGDGEYTYNTWHHIVVEYQTNGSILLYVNGNINNLIGGVQNCNTLYPFWSNLEIGLFNGLLDHFSVFETSLNQQEIQQYMNCSPTGNESGLVGLWNFEDNSNPNIVLDQTQNGNHGTINGATYDTNVPSQSCNLTNANGCDSTAILNLTINNSVTTTNTVSICSGDSFTVGTSTYNTGGTYTDILTTINGCDSTVTTILTLDPLGCTDASAFNYDANAICDDGSCIATVNGCTDTTACNYDAAANTDDGGCNYATSSTTNAVACDDYTWNGITYDSSGTYSYNSVGNNINNSYSVNFNGGNDYINIGRPLNLYNGDVGSFSVWFKSTASTGGSVFISNDTQPTNPELNFGLVDGLVYVNGGPGSVNPPVVTSTNTYTDGLWHHAVAIKSGSNCVELYVDNQYIGINCSGSGNMDTGDDYFIGDNRTSGQKDYIGLLDEFRIYNKVLSSTEVSDLFNCSGSSISNLVVYYDFEAGSGNMGGMMQNMNNPWNTDVPSQNCQTILTNASGCDSTAVLNLTINNAVTNSNTVSICSGDSFSVGTSTYNTDGTYTDVLTTVDGCDSTVTTILTLDPLGCTDASAFNYDANAICDDGSCIATVNGCTDPTACNYDISANTDDGGCNYVTTSATNITACDSYAWNGQTYTSSSQYTWLGVNSNGCDSVATLNLTINSSTSSTTDVTACDSYAWNGQTYTSSSQYTWLGVNSNGCDSVATLNLTINSSTSSTTDVTACDSYAWNGQTYTSSSQYTWLGVNSNGCDSVATLNLTINSSTSSTTNITACDSYAWNGQTYTSSSQYTWLGVNSNGCDSVATLNLTINSSTSSTTDVTACDSYAWNGQTYTSSSQYTWLGVNSNGCDSVATLNLTINSSTSSTTDVTACDSYAWNGQTYTSSSQYTWLGVNSNGCDSVATLNLTINSSTSSTTDVTACDSYDWNGQVITSSGNYTQILTNIFGCDSTHILVVTIDSSNTGTNSVTGCDSYSWNGQTITSSGNYNQTFTNVAGCDSTHTLIATIIFTTIIYDTISICKGESYVVSSSTYNNTGDYTDTILNSNGCLSIIYTNLTVGSSLISSITQVGSVLESTVNGGFMPYSYLWNTLATTEDINITSSGLYWLVVTDSLSCPVDTAYYNGVLHTSISEIGISDLKVYPNPSRDIFNIVFSSNTIQNLDVRVINVVGEVIVSEELDQFLGEYSKQINLEKNAKGIYFLEIETNEGIINKKLILQ